MFRPFYYEGNRKMGKKYLMRHVRQNIPTWNSSIAYWGGDRVIYNGRVYEAKWWTQGDMPGQSVQHEWDTPWKLVGESTPTQPEEPAPIVNLQEEPEPIPQENILYPDYSSVDVGQGIQWPKTVFAPYIDATGWPPLTFANMANELMIPYFNLGFIVSENDSSYLPTWGTYYAAGDGPLNEQIKLIREMGGDVIVSFGGLSNVPIHVTAPNVNVLKEQYKAFIKAYGLTRVDFNIEGQWLSDTPSLKRNSEALKLLQDELIDEGYPLEIWFTLPVLPSGLTPLGIDVLRYALDEDVTINGVNIMTMDYGEAVAPNPENNMGEYGIAAAESLLNQLKFIYADYGMTLSDEELFGMIGMTPMIGMNDITTEIFYQEDARETLAYANDKNLGMLSMWSLNRDKECPGGETNYVSITCSSVLQKPYEFSKIFNQYNDLRNFNPALVNQSNEMMELPDIDELTDMTYSEWSPTQIYVAGDRVIYDDNIYEAKWWTQGDRPGQPVQNEWDTPWNPVITDIEIPSIMDEELPSIDELMDTETEEIEIPLLTYPEWSATQIYVAGDRVDYEGKIYEAKWWTQGDDPSVIVKYPWESPWERIG